MKIIQTRLMKNLKSDSRTHLSILIMISINLLLLRKGVYPYEYMDEWEKFIEKSLPEKEEFYSSLNMEDITDADYFRVKRISRDLDIKHLDEYHNTLLYITLHYLILSQNITFA